MYYDEEARRRQDRMSQILGIPVTDFELSVRSRNCLQKMGVRTLGDLTRTSEQEAMDLMMKETFQEEGEAVAVVDDRKGRHGRAVEFADEKSLRVDLGEAGGVRLSGIPAFCRRPIDRERSALLTGTDSMAARVGIASVTAEKHVSLRLPNNFPTKMDIPIIDILLFIPSVEYRIIFELPSAILKGTSSYR